MNYVYTYVHYIDKPVIEITTATGGYGYVYVSWIVIGKNDICEIVAFHVLLLSIPVGLPVRKQISTEMNSYNFTGLPDDALFAITIIGSSVAVNTDPASTSVRTMILNGK